MPDDTPATPGQAAYEAHRVVIAVSLGLDLNGADDFDGPPAEWEALAPSGRAAWEAAAEAANRAGLARVLAECARYKAERDAAREELAELTLIHRARGDLLRDAVADRDRYRAALERCADEEYPGHAVQIATAALEATP